MCLWYSLNCNWFYRVLLKSILWEFHEYIQWDMILSTPHFLSSFNSSKILSRSSGHIPLPTSCHFFKNNPLNPIAPFHECMGWAHVLEHKQAISVHILKNWYFLSAAINWHGSLVRDGPGELLSHLHWNVGWLSSADYHSLRSVYQCNSHVLSSLDRWPMLLCRR